MFKLFIFFSLFIFTNNINAQTYQYSDFIEQAGILKCQHLVDKNFDYFNRLKVFNNPQIDEKIHMDGSYFKSPDNLINSLRLYFNYSFEEPIIGDVSFVQTSKYCQSFLNILMVDDSVTCEQWKQANGNQWRDLENNNTINWANNEKFNALFQKINNNNGCAITIYITDIEFFN